MKKNLYTRFLLILLFLNLYQYLVFAQIKSGPLTREIIVTKNDSVFRSSILVNDPDIKPLNLMYFWYYDSDIKSNVGGYGGDLLHGEYTVYDKNNNMAVKGSFSNGVKNGLWKYWFSNGNIKMELNWSSGNLDGVCLYYNSSGTINKSEKYKKNKLQEVTTYDHSGKIINTIAYRDGVVKENLKTEKKSKNITEEKKPLIKLFTSSKKENERKQNEEENLSQEKEKKSFIKFLKFSKKENEETVEF